MMWSFHSEKGVSIYLAVMILAIVLGVALGISSLIVNEVRILRGIGDSVIAFYAAEAGVERELLEFNPIGTITSGTLPNNASYTVEVIDPSNPNCGGLNFCIDSLGEFRQAQRAVWTEF